MKNSKKAQAKNLANFRRLLDCIQQLSTDYNPANPQLSLENLQKTYTQAHELFEQQSNTKTLYQKAVNERKKAFNKLIPTVNRVLNSAKSQNICPLDIYNLKQTAQRLYGRTPATQNPELKRSITQLSFDMKISNFHHYINQLENQIGYTANETELQTQNLRKYALALQQQTDNVNHLHFLMKQQNDAKRQALQNPQQSIAALAKQAKLYIISLYGRNSEPYRQLQTMNYANNLN